MIGLPCPLEVSGEKGRLVRANWSPPGLALNSPPTGHRCTRVACRVRVAFEEQGWIGLGWPGQVGGSVMGVAPSVCGSVHAPPHPQLRTEGWGPRGGGGGTWQHFVLTDAGPTQALMWVLWKRTTRHPA